MKESETNFYSASVELANNRANYLEQDLKRVTEECEILKTKERYQPGGAGMRESEDSFNSANDKLSGIKK